MRRSASWRASLTSWSATCCALASRAAVVGSPETVCRGLAAFVEKHRPDEVIVTAQIYDHAARIRSFEILAEAAGQLAHAA